MHKFCQPESSPTGVNTSAQRGRSVGDPPPSEESVRSQSCLPCGAVKVQIQIITQPNQGHSTKDCNPKKTGKTGSNTENRRGNSFVSSAARKHTCFQIFTAKHLITKQLRDDTNRGGIGGVTRKLRDRLRGPRYGDQTGADAGASHALTGSFLRLPHIGARLGQPDMREHAADEMARHLRRIDGVVVERRNDGENGGAGFGR
jgi:hypothetical protein